MNTIIIVLIICITIIICGILGIIYQYVVEKDNYSIHKNKFNIERLENKIERLDDIIDTRDKFYCEKIDQLFNKIKKLEGDFMACGKGKKKK